MNERQGLSGALGWRVRWLGFLFLALMAPSWLGRSFALQVGTPPEETDEVLGNNPPSVLANEGGKTGTKLSNQTGGEFYVAPTGSADGDGSAEQPWSLEAALNSSRVQPGDTILVRDGTYRGGFTSTVSGTVEAPVTVAVHPGEHVVLDTYDPVHGGSPDIVFAGDHVHYRGFEVTSSNPASRVTDQRGSWPTDIRRGTIIGQGSHNKYINFVVHDLNQGFSFWSSGSGGEIYGSIIYNNGWQGPDRWHGHGIYTQNETGTKVLRDNIIFSQYGLGIQAYGSSSASVQGYHIEGNTVFGNRMVIGGEMVAKDITLQENYTYSVVDVGYPWGPHNEDLRVVDNYFVGGVRFQKGWSDVEFTGNTVTRTGPVVLVQMVTPPGVDPSTYNWDNNDYRSIVGTPFSYQGGKYWDTWRAAMEADASGTFTDNGPSGTDVFVRPNQYEQGRANITVYNWDEHPTVQADLSGVLEVSHEYAIHHVFDLFGEPVASGVYDGTPIELPMTSRTAPAPAGYDEIDLLTMGPEFGAFLVTSPWAMNALSY